MDRVGAFVLSLLMAFIALWCGSIPAILFRQPRFGAGRSVVVVSKFRTMRPRAPTSAGAARRRAATTA